jgi:hypothetical protein
MWILEAAKRKKQHSGAKMNANPFLLPPNFVHQNSAEFERQLF